MNSAVSAGAILGDRYQILRELGHGGFSRTYLARDRRKVNDRCVLKEFAPQLQSAQAMEKARELFIREAGVLSELQHPQIPRFRDLLQLDGSENVRLFLVQDYVEGQTYRECLNRRLQEGRLFSEAEIIQWLSQLLPVLDYIHVKGAIHRDISPDNLMLRSCDLLPVLIDFGGVKPIAAFASQEFTSSDPLGAVATQLGKFGYAPDEQIVRGLVFPHSDLYALAVTALVLMTGQEPQQWIDPVSLDWTWQEQVSLSPRLRQIFHKMLAKSPGDRFPSARHVLQKLQLSMVHRVTPSVPTSLSTVAFAQKTLSGQSPFPQRAAMLVEPPTCSDGKPSADVNNRWGSWPQGLLRHVSKSLLTLGLSVSAGLVGWMVGQTWIAQVTAHRTLSDEGPLTQASLLPSHLLASPNPSPSKALLSVATHDSVTLATPISQQEWERKNQLRSRRLNLQINADFFSALTQAHFRVQYPGQQGRTLTAHPDDQLWRERWDGVADAMLTNLSYLSPEARQLLGHYNQAHRDRWKQEVNQLRLSSRALYDLADAIFFTHFPDQEGKPFMEEPIGQVWNAIVFDQLKALQNGESYESLHFNNQQANQHITSQLKPGQGKTYVAHLSAGQRLQLQLETDQAHQLSIYTPTGQTSLLEDSPQHSWSGYLDEEGYYEFVVVSKAAQPLHFHLNILLNQSGIDAAERGK